MRALTRALCSHRGGRAASRQLITLPLPLVRRFEGKDLTARIEMDGKISFRGEKYDSFWTAGSAAKASVIGTKPGEKDPATNGWDFWKCQTPDGSLVTIGSLRQKIVTKPLLRRVGKRDGDAGRAGGSANTA